MELEKRTTEELLNRRKDLEYLGVMGAREGLELAPAEVEEHARILRELQRRRSENELRKGD